LKETQKMASEKHFLITLSFLLLFKLCVSSPVTDPKKPEIEEQPGVKPEIPEMPENLCPLPPQLGYLG
jgi:hypothetical protein